MTALDVAPLVDRALAGLTVNDDQRGEAWVAALEAAGAGVPAAEIVRRARLAARRSGRPPRREVVVDSFDRVVADLPRHRRAAALTVDDDRDDEPAADVLTLVPRITVETARAGRIAGLSRNPAAVNEQLRHLARVKSGRAQFVGEITAALYALGADRLPAEHAATVAALVALAQAHPTEFARLRHVEHALRARRLGVDSPAGVVEIVARVFGLTVEQLRARNANVVVNVARQVAWAMAHRYTDSSTAEIGNVTGHGRSTVAHALARWADNLTDPTVAAKVAAASAQLETLGGRQRREIHRDRRCTCGTALRDSNRTGLCRTCAAKAHEAYGVCDCGAPLGRENTSGRCRACNLRAVRTNPNPNPRKEP